jgi:hypothetical protein
MKKHSLRTSLIVSPLAVLMGRVLTVATLSVALGGMALAAPDNDTCSNATLTGNYAFTIVSELLNPNGTTSFTHGIALTNFDGAGKLTQQDFVVTDGKATPANGNSTTGFHFATGQTGTYRVNPDCTGSAEIDLNAPVPSGSRGVIKLIFVLSNHGRSIHTVVAEFTPPGATAPVLNTTRSDGFKVDDDDQSHGK